VIKLGKKAEKRRRAMGDAGYEEWKQKKKEKHRKGQKKEEAKGRTR